MPVVYDPVFGFPRTIRPQEPSLTAERVVLLQKTHQTAVPPCLKEFGWPELPLLSHNQIESPTLNSTASGAGQLLQFSTDHIRDHGPGEFNRHRDADRVR